MIKLFRRREVLPEGRTTEEEEEEEERIRAGDPVSPTATTT